MIGLWDAALKVYAAPGVEALCLELQDDHGVDVPLLLASLWAWAGQAPIDGERARALGSASASWQAQVVGPLRSARRALRRGSDAGHGLALEGTSQAAFKSRVQALELAAERLQLEALERAVRAWSPDRGSSALLELLAALAPGFRPRERFKPLVEAAVALRNEMHAARE